MMTPKELYDLLTKVYNEAYDGIAELMRKHECDHLDLMDYEDDLYLPSCFVWDDMENLPVVAKVTDIYLVPGHIEFDFDHYNEGGFICHGNEAVLSPNEMLDLYYVVNTIFKECAVNSED